MRFIGKVLVMILLGIAIGGYSAWSAPCSGTTAACSLWGANNSEYSGYCCSKHGNAAGMVYVPGADGWCRARKNPSLAQCGDLKDVEWDSMLMQWVCNNVISQQACGGDAGVIGGCVVNQCGGG